MDGSGHTEPGGARDVPALVRLATRQHNAVSRSQLSELQFDRKSVARLVERGWAHPAYRSVYAIGRDRLDLHGRMVAGNLLGGPRSAVVRHGAAWLHGIGDEPSLVEVIAPRKVTVRSDICFHRSTQLREDECMEVAGVRVTTIERTLIDLADVLTPDQLAHVMYRADFGHQVDDRRLRALLRRHAGRPRIRILVRALELRAGGSAGSRSRTEARLIDRLQRSRFANPENNVQLRMPGHRAIEVDFLWRAHRLCVELDGEQHHRPRDRVRDAERDAALRANGFRVLRFATLDVVYDLDAVVREIEHVLRRRPARVRSG